MPIQYGSQKVRQELDNILKSFEGIQNVSVKEFQAMVNELRRHVVLIIADQQQLDSITISRIRAELDSIVQVFNQKFADKLSEDQRRVFIKGIQVVDRGIKAQSIQAAVPYLDESALDQMKSYGAELITNLTDDMKSKVVREVILASSGQKSTNDVINTIGRNLSDKSIFSTMSRRAEIITRNELNRMFGVSAIERSKQLSQQVTDLVKQWNHSHVGVPRLGHLALHGVQIPVAQKFTLVGVDGSSTYEIDGPQDRTLPAEETINCKCWLVVLSKRFLK